MALLAGVNYDPGTAVAKSTASRLAMTAFDTTNLRLTFTVPASGNVMIRIRCNLQGATTFPTILLGVLEGSTVIARQSPLGSISGTALATTRVSQEALFCVTGLTPGASKTYDAAYGVEILLASTNINYGGPDNASGANAWGGLSFEIYDCPSLLGAKMYDPSSAATKACSSLLAMTAFDTTNLRITFTAPATGNVLVRMRVPTHGATTFSQMLLGVMDGATIKGRTQPMGALKTTAVATAQLALEGQFVVSGLTPGGSYSYDAAYAVQTAVASTNFKYGGPNDTTTDNAWGAFCYEIWAI